MGKGYLEVIVTTALGLLPIEGARVIISKFTINNENEILGFLETNSSGKTIPFVINAPDASFSQNSGNTLPFATCNIFIQKENFYEVKIENVQIFDGIKTIQNVNLLPLKENQTLGEEFIIITPQNL